MRARGAQFSSQNTHTYTPFFALLPPQAHSPTSFTPGCQGGVRKSERAFLFLLSQWEALLRHSGIFTIVILSLLFPKASLVGNFYLFSSPYSPGLMEESKRGEKQIGKELERTRFPLNDSLSPCSCLNEIRKCVRSEVNLPLTAPTQHTSLDLHLNEIVHERSSSKFDQFEAPKKQRLQDFKL